MRRRNEGKFVDGKIFGSNSQNLFRGFVGGAIFNTKRGFKGMKLDSLWAKYVLESFTNDDAELVSIALESCLANLRATVCGGNYGTPFTIGDYGFYSDQQFTEQFEILKSVEENHVQKSGIFLSDSQWTTVEDNLKKVANYSVARFKRTCRGDNWATLAVRENAFGVAEYLLSRGLDPLEPNEEGCDLVDTLRRQYGALTVSLRSLQDEKKETVLRLLLPSDKQAMLEKESRIIGYLRSMRRFTDALSLNLEKRIVEIEKDKREKRKADARKELLSFEMLKNIEKYDKSKKHAEECVELKEYIDQKLNSYDEFSRELPDMADFLQEQHDALLSGRQPLYPSDYDPLSTKRKTRSRQNAALTNQSGTESSLAVDNDTTEGDGVIPSLSTLTFAESVAKEHLRGAGDGSAKNKGAALGILQQDDYEIILYK